VLPLVEIEEAEKLLRPAVTEEIGDL